MIYDRRLDALEQDMAQPRGSEERALAIRSLATGYDDERMLAENYLPGWLDEDELRLTLETGYRAVSWAHDVSPYEVNDPESIRDAIPTP
jgi:hypothetical protein